MQTYVYRQAASSGCNTSTLVYCTYLKGDLWKIVDAVGQVTEYVRYDSNGHVASVKDANGSYTDYSYNSRDWFSEQVTRASSSGVGGTGDAITHFEYDGAGNLVEVTQGYGTTDAMSLSYDYDDAHRLRKVTDALGNSIDYCPGVGTADCLDAAGNRRVEQFKYSSGLVAHTLRRQFDSAGRLLKLVNNAGLATFDASTGYDSNGNLIRSVDGFGVATVLPP